MPGQRVTPSAAENAKRLLRYYSEMGYQNCCVSTSDLGAGTAFLKKNDYSGSVFISENILKDKKRVFEPGRLYNVKGLKVAVIGLTDKVPARLQDKDGRMLEIQDPSRAFEKTWKSIKGRADLVILLTSLNRTGISRLLRDHPKIDLVISSGIGMPTYVPLKEGKALIVSTHPKGKSVGIISLKVRKGTIQGYDNKLIMLRDSAIQSIY